VADTVKLPAFVHIVDRWVKIGWAIIEDREVVRIDLDDDAPIAEALKSLMIAKFGEGIRIHYVVEEPTEAHYDEHPEGSNA